VGTLTPEGARMTGLNEGTQVICGATDTVMEVYANGAIRPGQMTLKLATAGRICLITEGPINDRRLFNYQHVVPGLWYPGTGTKSCASSYRWYRDALCADERFRAEAESVDAYVLMDKMAETVEPGSSDLFFHPYLQGESTPYFDERLRGSFVGVSSAHNKEHFTRALLEGVAYSLRDSLDVMRLYAEPTEAVVIGGGAKSPLWRQIVADVLGLRLVRTKDSDSSLGTAMLAGVASGVFSSFEDSVRTCVKYAGETVLPNEDLREVYDRGFGIYKQIHDALEPVYHRMADS
jgi:xylulokinase